MTFVTFPRVYVLGRSFPCVLDGDRYVKQRSLCGNSSNVVYSYPRPLIQARSFNVIFQGSFCDSCGIHSGKSSRLGSLRACFSGLKLQVGNKSSDQRNYYENASKAGDHYIGLRLQSLRIRLLCLKLKEKVSVVFFSAILFGSLASCNLFLVAISPASFARGIWSSRWGGIVSAKLLCTILLYGFIQIYRNYGLAIYAGLSNPRLPAMLPNRTLPRAG
jgi:hypothetical protein